jgi:hypothetical protein
MRRRFPKTMTSTKSVRRKGVEHARFPKPRNDSPSVLSFDSIEALGFIWMGRLCGKSSVLGSCFSSFSTWLFDACFREDSPSADGDNTADEDDMFPVVENDLFTERNGRSRRWTWTGTTNVLGETWLGSPSRVDWLIDHPCSAMWPPQRKQMQQADVTLNTRLTANQLLQLASDASGEGKCKLYASNNFMHVNTINIQLQFGFYLVGPINPQKSNPCGLWHSYTLSRRWMDISMHKVYNRASESILRCLWRLVSLDEYAYSVSHRRLAQLWHG